MIGSFMCALSARVDNKDEHKLAHIVQNTGA